MPDVLSVSQIKRVNIFVYVVCIFGLWNLKICPFVPSQFSFQFGSFQGILHLEVQSGPLLVRIV